jgi:hypothetical protein
MAKVRQKPDGAGGAEMQGKRFVVVVDAIVGRGAVYRRGHVLEEGQLWGYAECLELEEAVRLLPEPARTSESTPVPVYVC